jgi:predicted cupin superfamily sugar epimerase
MPELSAADVIRLLELTPHPEGGHYRETLRDPRVIEGRSASTAIYFLLARGERSHWHRIDAVEVWHYYAGAPLALAIAAERPAGSTTTLRLGSDLAAGERPQATVPAGVWQAAESLGAWTLVGCTVAPGFALAGFELAPPGWSPAG